MRVRAVARQIGVSPRKVRLVLRELPGKRVEDALTLLQFMPTPAAREVAKVVKSAAANAEHNFNLLARDLRVTSATASAGMTLKRWKARSRGRPAPRLKRSSHITVVVEDTEA
ncbi:MAG: 50S ribosomal protein L22 [Dehalococcoidia bacterium]|nr:50S ribosomal protein L22 [Dehalococcoidia bacterium]